ncbi:MAG: hypothetical protein IPO30_08120 [Hyphomonadaceae bacterium]|nr:hypothetical protein [Hyphomonadaceae bacterium]
MGANWSFGLCLENAFNAEHIVQALDLSDWIGKVQKYYGKPRRLRARLSWDVWTRLLVQAVDTDSDDRMTTTVLGVCVSSFDDESESCRVESEPSAQCALETHAASLTRSASSGIC